MSEAPDNTIRQIQVLGAKPKDLTRRRRTRKVRAEEGDAEEETLLPLTKSQPLVISKSQESITPPQPAKVAPNLPSPAPQVQPVQPTIRTKVVLKPKEKQTPKVLLKKKENIPGPELPIKPTTEIKGAGLVPAKAKTRKVVLNSFHKRVNKTRHALTQAKELPIESIRAVLIDKKLIKPNSKAPESILRQIYSDSLIVAKKTL